MEIIIDHATKIIRKATILGVISYHFTGGHVYVPQRRQRIIQRQQMAHLREGNIIPALHQPAADLRRMDFFCLVQHLF